MTLMIRSTLMLLPKMQVFFFDQSDVALYIKATSG